MHRARLAGAAAHFDRIALDAEQVQQYGVTPRPPKPSEHPGMLDIAECAEVDFLRSEQVEEIVREGIERGRQNRGASYLDSVNVASRVTSVARPGAVMAAETVIWFSPLAVRRSRR